MPDYRLSNVAAGDLLKIHEFGIKVFGLNQAGKYRGKLESCFRNLAEHPLLGREAHGLDAGIRRLECQSHVVFYKIDADGVWISRVLHASMDLQKHYIPE